MILIKTNPADMWVSAGSAAAFTRVVKVTKQFSRLFGSCNDLLVLVRLAISIIELIGNLLRFSYH